MLENEEEGSLGRKNNSQAKKKYACLKTTWTSTEKTQGRVILPSDYQVPVGMSNRKNHTETPRCFEMSKPFILSWCQISIGNII